MEAYLKKIASAPMDYPFTVGMRNILDSNSNVATRQVEFNTGNGYYTTVTLFKRGTMRQLFHVKKVGASKKRCLEECYSEVASFMSQFRTQGDDLDSNQVNTMEVAIDESSGVVSKEENVIIKGADVSVDRQIAHKIPLDLLKLSSSEKIYDFTTGDSAIMNRWMPLDTLTVSNTIPGLVKSWRIIEDIANMDNINILPIRGFMMGHFNLEFKIVMQGVPQQACLLMLGHCPNPFGLFDKYWVQSGVTSGTDTATVGKVWPAWPTYKDVETYLSLDASVMRPNVQVSLESGGEATLLVNQKYHKTMIRNFDYSTVSETNPGVRGGYQGLLTLHALTKVLTGTGTAAAFDVRIFYRFIDAKLTAMTQPVQKKEAAIRVKPLFVVPANFTDYAIFEHTNDVHKNAERAKAREAYRVQGPAMSILGGVKAVSQTATGIIESIEGVSGYAQNKRIKNKDKPVDAVSQVSVAPRPRPNFMNGEGPDSAVVVGLSWVELSLILQSFIDEPKSYKDLLNIPCLFKQVDMNAGVVAGTQLWSWSLQPTDYNYPLNSSEAKDKGYALARLSTTVGICSSGFTNYTGTMILTGQFVKTMFHKGSIEISIRFGRNITGDALENSYVTIVNIQDSSAFEVTIPYIYDTPMRSLTGSSTPQFLPNPTNTQIYEMAHSAKITIRVLNKLIAPDSVSSVVPLLIWLRGGRDFSLNHPRSYNSNLMPPIVNGLYANPQVIAATQGITTPQQFALVTHTKDHFMAVLGNAVFQEPMQTQADDFNSPSYTGNVLTDTEHLNFKSIMKMPVKILNYFSYTPWIEFEIEQDATNKVKVKERNYISVPVAPLNSTFVQWLTNQMYGDNDSKARNLGVLTQSHQYVINTFYGMFSGSLVYTIVIDSGTAPVYFSYLPHDYSLRKLYGPLNRYLTNAVATWTSTPILTNRRKFKTPFLGTMDEDNVDLSMAGGYTGMIIPGVNPTERIVVPMSAPLNWLLMNRSIFNTEGTEKLVTMRENSEWFNGHIALWSNSDFKCSIYLSCGDEFELGGFIGHPGLYNPYSQYNINDDRRTKLSGTYKVQGPVESEYDIQMKMWELNTIIDKPKGFQTQGVPDFSLKDLTLQGWKSFKQMMMSTTVSTVAGIVSTQCDAGMSPIVGAIAIYTAMGGVQQMIEMGRIASQTSELGPSFAAAVKDSVSNSVATVSDLVTLKTEELTETAMLELRSIVDALFPFLKSSVNFMNVLWRVSQQLIHAALAQTWANAGFALFNVLMEMGLVNFKDWHKLGDFFEKFLTKSSQFVTQGPIDDTAWNGLMQVLTAIICAKVQVKADKGLRSYLAKIFWSHDYRNVSGLNSILSLVRTFMNGVSAIVNWAFKEADPNVALLAALQNQGEDLEVFANEASEFLTFFTDLQVNKRENRIKYLSLILRAIKIREALIRINDPRVAGPLLQVCTKVIDKANSIQYLLQCDLVKQEPFILCMEGETAIGKSFSVYHLVGQMLSAADFKLSSPDYLYSVNCALDYMNGLRSSHIAWWMDDAFNMKDIDSVRKFVQIIFGIKTSAPYNVPRAELENKEQIGQPILVIQTVNKENTFPDCPDVPCLKALWRRRDCLVQFVLKPEYSNLSVVPPDVLDRWEHLEVNFYTDVANPTSLVETKMPYNDFVKVISQKFIKHLATERKNQQKKYSFLMQCMEKNAIDSLNIGNPFDIIHKCNYSGKVGDIKMLLEEEVQILMIEIKRAEKLKLRIPDDGMFEEEIANKFETQGILEDTGEYLLRIRRRLGELVKKFWDMLSNATIRCNRCSQRAFSSGVALWCSLGAHYLCLSCATAIQRSCPNIGTMVCPMHPGSQIQLPTSSLLKSFVANVVDAKMRGTSAILNMLSASLEGNKDSMALAQIVRLLNMTMNLVNDFHRLKTQGDVTSDMPDLDEIPELGDLDDLKSESGYEEMTHLGGWLQTFLQDIYTSTQYYELDKFATSQDLKEKYLYLMNMDHLKYDFPYVCQHSLLVAKYHFYGGKFVIVEEPDITIDDELCEGMCVLGNCKFQSYIKTQLDTSWENCQLLKNFDRETIEKRWPKFMWPARMKQVLDIKERVRRFLSTNWWEEYVPKNPILAKIFKISLPLLAIMGVAWGCAKAATYLWEWISKFTGFAPQSSHDNDYGEKSRRKVRRDRHVRLFATQSVQNFENKLNKIASNYIVISSGEAKVTAWGLKASVFLMPKHLVRVLYKNEEFEISFPCRNEEPIIIRQDNIKVEMVHERDLVKVEILRGKILFKDCSKFLQRRTITEWVDKRGTIMQLDKDGVVDVETHILATTDWTTASNGRGEIFENSGGVMYDYQKTGLCGSLLCVDSNNPIISMHISGSEPQNRGIGVVLYQEDFEVQGASLFEGDCEELIEFGDGCVLTYCGVVEPSLTAHIPDKTSIIPSVITNDLDLDEPKTFPAFLSKADQVFFDKIYSYPFEETPLVYGVRKNGRPTVDFPSNVVERAYNVVKDLVLSGRCLEKQYIKIFSMEEAITGINLNLSETDRHYFGTLPLDTSAGWPYSTPEYQKKYGVIKKDKSGWLQIAFGIDGLPESCTIHDKIREDHENNMCMRAEGEVAFNVFQDCLKDERRKYEKMMSPGGTRLFSMSNIEGSIALRRYTMSLVNHIRGNRILNGIGVGINPESMEWTVLANVLKRHPNYFTTDFTNFGAGLNYDCGMKFANLVIDYFTGMGVILSTQDKVVIDMLIRELMGSYHIAHRTIYKTIAGSPSGACITVEINSFVHLMYVMICWIVVCEVIYEKNHNIKGKFRSKYVDLDVYLGNVSIEMEVDDFRSNVVACVYGDDGIFSVSDAYVRVFNGVVINLILKEHKIGVTDGVKSAQIREHVSFDECTFLKRKFVDHPLISGMALVAQIDWISVEECVRWIHKKPYSREHMTKENCEASLYLAWGHGREKYEAWREKLNKALKKYSLSTIEMNWEEVARKFFPELVITLY